jgi:hypothetical protein
MSLNFTQKKFEFSQGTSDVTCCNAFKAGAGASKKIGKYFRK